MCHLGHTCRLLSFIYSLAVSLARCAAVRWSPGLLTCQSWASITKAPLRHRALERHLICGGNLSHKQPRGDFNIYSAVCSAYVSFGKQLTLAHYTQMKADLQTGQRPHSLCGEVSPSYEAMSLFTSLPPSCRHHSAHAYWTAPPAPPLQTRGPRLTWCILYVNMVLMYFKMQTRL